MVDTFEHDKPYGLTADYQESPEASSLAAPYDLHAIYVAPDVPQVEAIFYTEVSAPVLALTADYDFNVDRYLTNQISDQQQQAKLHTVLAKSLYQISNAVRDQHGSDWDAAQALSLNTSSTFADTANIESEKVEKWQASNRLEHSASDRFGNNQLARQAAYEQWRPDQRLARYTASLFKNHIQHKPQFADSWQTADQHSITFGFGYNAAVWIRLIEQIVWERSQSPRSGVSPPDGGGVNPKPPDYEGTTDLNFICKLKDVDPLNVVLNFGDHPCPGEIIPAVPSQQVYFIMNDTTLTRVSDDMPIELKSVNVSIDKNSWCWSFSAALPYTELEKVQPNINGLVEVELNINGNLWRMLIEQYDQNREFAQSDVQITGRSVTAFLDAPYAATRSYSQTTATTSRQLADNELERVSSDLGFSLDWNLVDPLGWSMPANAWSYTNLTPVAAIKQIAEGGGGFLNSHMNERQLLVKPVYPAPYWQWSSLTPDLILPYDIVLRESLKWEEKPQYNAVYVQGDTAGVRAFVKLTGTAGDYQAPMVVDAMIGDEAVARQRGITILAAGGKQASVSLELPMHVDIGVIEPSKLLKITGQGDWYGLSHSVSISSSIATDGKITTRQSIELERHY